MNEVKFIQTTKPKLSTIAVKAGQVILCTDSGEIYQDTIGGGRVKYSAVSGSAPVSVVDNTISISDATSSQSGAMPASDKAKLDKVTIPSATTGVTLGSSTTSTILIRGNSTNKVAIAIHNSQDNSEYHLLAKPNSLNLWNNTTGTTEYAIYPTTGTSPINVSSGVVSISPATASSAGSMSAADKTKLNKVVYAAGIESVNFGDGNHTVGTYLWGNDTNLVGVGIDHYGRDTWAGRINLLAREDRLKLQRSYDIGGGEGAWYDVWDLNMKGINECVRARTIGAKYNMTGAYGGYVTYSSKNVIFTIQHGYLNYPTATGSRMYPFQWATVPQNISDTNFIGRVSSNAGVLIRAQTGYLTPGTINTDGSPILDRIKITLTDSSEFSTTFRLTAYDASGTQIAWTTGADGTTRATNNTPVAVTLNQLSMVLWEGIG